MTSHGEYLDVNMLVEQYMRTHTSEAHMYTPLKQIVKQTHAFGRRICTTPIHFGSIIDISGNLFEGIVKPAKNFTKLWRNFSTP